MPDEPDRGTPRRGTPGPAGDRFSLNGPPPDTPAGPSPGRPATGGAQRPDSAATQQPAGRAGTQPAGRTGEPARQSQTPEPRGRAALAGTSASQRPSPPRSTAGTQTSTPAGAAASQASGGGGGGTSKLEQTQRLFWIETPLGPDKVLIRSMKGKEFVSQLFTFNLDLVSEDFNLDFDKIVGKNITFSIKQSDEVTERYFNGYVRHFAQRPHEGRLAIYEAEVVSWLWFLTQTADCYIHQNLSVPDIVERVFKKFGFNDFEWQLQQNYTPWEYCVQYRETACNFVMRLLEAEGIFFFFRHEQGKHTLVLADSPSAHKPCPFKSKFRYEHVFGRGIKREEDTVWGWNREENFRPGKYTHTEYNFETPSANLRAETSTRFGKVGETRYELYDYPGEYEKRDEGDVWGRLRMEEQEVEHDVVFADSNCRSMGAGFRFELTEHERKDQNGNYILLSVEHTGQEGGFYSGIGSKTEASYHNVFSSMRYPSPYRPPRLTRKPFIRGTQTAVVVGPKGEEIYSDKYGRVKVQFHWDRVGKKDEKSSCWIRVSQPWAGGNWGAVWLPRIGQEVVVNFLEGDPDRPLITGRVYNAEQMPPYTLPDHQTRSTFKSRSSKGGGSANYNEIRFEDKKGKEQVFIHAERDMDLSVENDSRELICRDRHLLVKRHQKEHVEKNKHALVEGDHKEKIDGDMSLKVGKNRHEKVGTVYSAEAGQEIHLKAGTKVIVEAGTQVSLKAGGGFVDIGPGGVTIQGIMVKINSGGSAGSGTAADPKDPEKPEKAEEG